MRGLAVLTAAAAAWVLAGGALPGPIWRGSSPRPVVVGGSVGVGAACTLLTLGLTAVPAVALAAGLLGAGFVPILVRARERRSRQTSASSWPDFLAALRVELAGGRSLPEAFLAAGYRKGGNFARMASDVAEVTARGVSFNEALEHIRGARPDPLTDRVVITLSTAHRTGGPRVTAVLTALGGSIADELRLRAAHEAALTQQRLTAAVALVAPWVLLILTVMTNPTASQAYRSSSGAMVIGAGVAATTVGYLLAIRIARLSQPTRVFR